MADAIKVKLKFDQKGVSAAEWRERERTDCCASFLPSLLSPLYPFNVSPLLPSPFIFLKSFFPRLILSISMHVLLLLFLLRSLVQVGNTGLEEYQFPWWDHVFNKAAQSIVVESNGEEEVCVRKGGRKEEREGGREGGRKRERERGREIGSE